MPGSGRLEAFASGLAWPEAPRWRNGRLWISDVWNFRLVSISESGAVHQVAEIDGRPSGMDFDAGGRICLATGAGRQILSVDPETGKASVIHDIGANSTGFLNDMILGPDGWGWVGDTGFLFGQDEPVRTGKIFAHHPDHGFKVAAPDLFFPNGMVIAPDGKTLYVCETFGKSILKFEIAADGGLTNRSVHAVLPGSPDGLCMDDAGCLWVPLLFEHAFVRLSPEGKVIERLEFPGKNPIACVFGGEDRKDLYLCLAAIDKSDPDHIKRFGEIYRLRPGVAGAGRP
ncbi:SMP-30/gluconolactonase/LRE family protein [uncultured Roseibium sp.]|uniref:SMP-30/gluconolactonase/LRE family protein n=1 Tax=uncultured Roseibium sp. TaxID=1936171 RepID=UPI003216F3C3